MAVDAGVAVCREVEQMRERVHGIWAGVADGWSEHAAYVDARGAGVAARMLELARPRPGEHVLELACGPGGVGLVAAGLVGPTGTVVVSDVVPAMAELAGARAAQRGFGNVQTRVLDLERIDEPDDAYDVVLVREGLMFAVEPGRAVREIARVLRPGGRLAVAVWGPRARNPWLGLIFDAASATLGKPIPPIGVPNPFSLDDEATLRTVLATGSFTSITVDELSTPVRSGSFDDWWHTTRALAGPLTALLGQMPAPALEELEERLRGAIAPYETEAGLELPGVTLLASCC